MIGFDIVSLSASEFDSEDRMMAYASKILTESEMIWWLSQANPFVVLWKVWTIKESVFKIESKLGAERLLVPKKYEVIGNGKRGIGGLGEESEVVGTLGKYHAITCEEKECVYSAVAQTQEELSAIRMAHFALESDIPDFQSMAVHQQLSQFLEQNPEIAAGLTAESSIDISVSHHGMWGGFAICPII